MPSCPKPEPRPVEGVSQPNSTLRRRQGLRPQPFPPLPRQRQPNSLESVLRGSQPLPRVKHLRKRSPKTAAAMREYIPEMLAFLEANPWCMSPRGCGRPSTELHHRRGRNGPRLMDKRYWAASCGPCNQWAETHTGEALACGWLLRINGQGDQDA